jgi:hypothetical protein
MLKSKKSYIIIGIVAIIIILAIIGAMASNNDAETVEERLTITASNLNELYEEMCEAVSNTEPNSSARVDAIASFAKEAATYPPTAGSKDIGNEAAALIMDSYPNYFESSELMEKLMLCGSYLENSYFGKDVSDCGKDVAQAVKYVYRGDESPESDSVKANLEQIAELIKK